MLSKWRHYGWCISLVLCLATAVLWVRSYRAGDAITYSHPGGRFYRLLSVRGVLKWETAPRCPYPTDGTRWNRFSPDLFYLEPPQTIGADGRVWTDTPTVGQQPATPSASLSIGYSVLVTVFGMVVAAAAVRHRGRGWMRRRPSINHCPRCGYNLTGNTSGVCPVCGTSTTAGVKA
jgi:hypothetical protein